MYTAPGRITAVAGVIIAVAGAITIAPAGVIIGTAAGFIGASAGADTIIGGSWDHSMIAIVDDHAALREALGSLVRSLGHIASTFGSAEDFLQSGRLPDTSCLITDVQMPGLKGTDLQDHLIAEGHRIPIIFITAHPDENIRARAIKAGAVGFLVKPIDPQHLTGCIEKALQAA